MHQFMLDLYRESGKRPLFWLTGKPGSGT
jgi:hypothetical protein